MILIRGCSVNFVSLIVGILVSLLFFLEFIYLVVMFLLATYLALVPNRILSGLEFRIMLNACLRIVSSHRFFLSFFTSFNSSNLPTLHSVKHV